MSDIGVNERYQYLINFCQHAGIVILYAFGSRAKEVQAWLKEEEHKLAPGPSDIDIGVKAHPSQHWTVYDKVTMALTLETFFGVHRVDLVVLEDVDPFLAANIIRGERLYAQDEDLADEYDLYILRRAGDCIPLERERLALILNRDLIKT
jgi:predicted nucleotidyltransferase